MLVVWMDGGTCHGPRRDPTRYQVASARGSLRFMASFRQVGPNALPPSSHVPRPHLRIRQLNSTSPTRAWSRRWTEIGKLC